MDKFIEEYEEGKVKLFGGYILSESPRRLVFEPGNPEAVWLVATKTTKPYQSVQCLVRELDGGSWEVLHHVRYQPITLPEILGAELRIRDKLYVNDEIRSIVKNRPAKFNHTTTAVVPRPGQKCGDGCNGEAVATLSSYNNGHTTSYLTRHFCLECLSTGEPVTANRICHLCRRVGAELTIYAEARGSNFHEFRVHRACAENYRTYLVPRPSLDERRPRRRVVLTPGPA